MGGMWSLRLFGQSTLIWSAEEFQQHCLLPVFQDLPGEVSSFAEPACHTCWRGCELQSVMLVLTVYTMNRFSLIDSSRLPKTLSPSSSQTMRLLYKSQFFLSFIIFICTLGLRGKVASSFQTSLCYHQDSDSLLNANELLDYYISCSKAFF